VCHYVRYCWVRVWEGRVGRRCGMGMGTGRVGFGFVVWVGLWFLFWFREWNGQELAKGEGKSKNKCRVWGGKIKRQRQDEL